jgi:hypothetical protein
MKLFERLDEFAKERNLFIKQFWNSNRICINFDEFV